MIFLHCDRTIEFHVAHGRYYRLRVPRFGRDIKYHYPLCDLFVVGDRFVLVIFSIINTIHDNTFLPLNILQPVK